MNETRPAAHASSTVDPVLDGIPGEFIGNDWFLRSYWPENKPRVRRMLTDLTRACPDRAGTRVIDVGCGNGYVTLGVARLGYHVTAVDMSDLPERDAMFAREGIAYRPVNLNDLEPFNDVPDASFDAALLGEVIEHILNHPLGLLRSVARVLKPDGLLILTTPNPSTLMNALRVLLDRHSLWGTREFVDLPKIARDARIISHDAIHYREYRRPELRRMVEDAGLDVGEASFMGTGAFDAQPWPKRLVKNSRFGRWISTWRPFAMTNYVVARRRRAR